MDFPSEKQICAAFGMNLYELRTEMKLTQEHLALIIGSKQPTISDIETGQSDARLTTVWKIISTLSNWHNAPVNVAGRLFGEAGKSND